MFTNLLSVLVLSIRLTIRRLILILIVATTMLTSCAAPIPTVAPTMAVAESPKSDTALPFARTACAEDIDLTGQAINFYQIVEETDSIIGPLMLGYEDATEYFNAHGGICGATLAQVFPKSGTLYNAPAIYDDFSTRNPKPVLITLGYSEDSVLLRDQLAQDEIPALLSVGGWYEAAYGVDGQSPGWVFLTNNPIYPDQLGSICDYLASNTDHFPEPRIGFMDFGGDSEMPHPEARAYCEALGIRFVGASRFPYAATNIQPQVQKLIDAGVNIIYTQSRLNGPALIAKTLKEMGLQGKITLIGSHLSLDPEAILAGQADLDANGLPLLNGLIGSMPARSWAESDHPGIQLITEQADRHERPLTVRTNAYIWAWTITDLFIEAYVQTGNRVGFDHVTGAEMKATLENLVYAPLGGVEQIDFRNARRSLSSNRVGQLNFLGQDGKTPAGPGNPPKVVKVDGQELRVPMILPLTDFQPAPDLRPVGKDSPEVASATTNTPGPSTMQLEPLVVKDLIAFRSDRAGNNDIYVMNGDGSGLINLTNNPYWDDLPAWSPDGTKIAFESGSEDRYDIFVVNVDGSGLTNITNNGKASFAPAWSPDGARIVFSSFRDGNLELYVMNADGSDQTRLTDNLAFDGMPDWSPDGRQIVFVSDREGQMDIYVMNSDGSGVFRLTDVGIGNIDAGNGFPKWSPDGTKIAFASSHDVGHDEIYVMNADGNNLIRLTNSQANNWAPSWSPHGRQILFNSERDGNAEIYVMNADGSRQTRLTDNVADDEMSVWQP